MTKRTKAQTVEFTDARFLTAHQKRNVFRAWIRFVRSGFDLGSFTKALYNHLIQHCSFIAHYNRGGADMSCVRRC